FPLRRCAARRIENRANKKRRELNANRGLPTLAQPASRTQLLGNARENSRAARRAMVVDLGTCHCVVGRDLHHVDRRFFSRTHEMVLRTDSALADSWLGAKPV